MFELTFLSRARIHEGRDAAALYFRVLHNGRYLSAYAGAVSGPDLVSFGPKLSREFWAALAHVATTAIGVRLLSDASPRTDPHLAETIWIKTSDLRNYMTHDLPLPVADEVFRTFDLEEDPLIREDTPTQARILSAGSSSISLKAAAVRSIGET